MKLHEIEARLAANVKHLSMIVDVDFPNYERGRDDCGTAFEIDSTVGALDILRKDIQRVQGLDDRRDAETDVLKARIQTLQDEINRFDQPMGVD